MNFQLINCCCQGGKCPGASLTYFNDRGGEVGLSDFFGSEILAQSDFFGSMKDDWIFLDRGKKLQRDFFGLRRKDQGIFWVC